MRGIDFKRAFAGLSAITLGLAATGAGAREADPAPATAPAPPAPAPPAAPAPAIPPPAAPPPRMLGPLVPGVCLLSQQALIAESKPGQAAAAHIQALGQRAQSELRAEQTKLLARGKAMEAKRATLTPMQIQAESQALSLREQSLQAEASERSKQLDVAKSKAFGAVIEGAQPLIAKAYAAHGCGLLLAREAAISGNFGNDITGEVIAALDAAPPQIAPPAAAPAPAPAPAPAKP